ncbi:MAG: GH92 family glycosyl hydrolase [Prolixibacteraceae bacterium]
MKIWHALMTVSFLFLLTCSNRTEERLTTFVNPFIGTDEDGHTFPGAVVPFGMVQLSPDNGEHGYNWCSGYHYSSNKISGFSHTHYSGTGAESLCDVSVFPLVNALPTWESVRSDFSHAEECATPGYYRVLLKSSGINAELTATTHCGLHRYTFPEGKNSLLRIDLGFGNGAESRVGHNGDEPLECYIKKINNNTIVGFRRSMGFVGQRCVFFAAQTSKSFGEMVLFAEGIQMKPKNEATAVRLNSYLTFPSTKAREELLVKVAISSASIEGAMAGLEEIPNWNFDEVKAKAEASWEKELRKIVVSSDDKSFKETFYTAVYHNYFAPFRFDDALGQYTGADKKIHQGKNIYTLHSLWDTYRATAPLFSLTQTERLPDIINSYLAFYKQHGLLPSWEMYFNEANVMPGYHAVPVIADAILKGIGGFNYNEAFEAMKSTANQNIRESDLYRQFGYVPDDKDPRQRGVTKTVEYAFDDWCIAQVAKKLNLPEDYKDFMKRSGYWRNVFDAASGFVRPKDSKGAWMLPFNPAESIGFQEGNAWIYTWYVPQDVFGLIEAMGGETRFDLKLDSLYNGPEKPYRDIKNHGFYGLSEFSNEPSHHVPYLYSYVGKPWKSAEKVNHILTKFYSNQPNGLCGNDDCGQTSAWYVLSAMGFYPVNPVSGEYVLGSPLSGQSELNFSTGRHFKIHAEQLSKQNIYIQRATLNGLAYTKSYIMHSDIIQGGELVLYMGGKPSDSWGVGLEDRPGRAVSK